MVIYTPHFFVKMVSNDFDNKPKLYLDRSLFNWVLEADCKSMLSITCHEKYT